MSGRIPLIVVIALALSASGLPAAITINNPSFESGTTGHGGTGSITGWTASSYDYGSGGDDNGSPFVGSGNIADGVRAAYLQNYVGQGASPSTLSQTLSGFVAGQTYWLSYRENARGAN